ncbi:MAG: hypothetical protein QNJ22_04595 [Desulfosarcinaceae bacterium]|nr:hypothetical protein [Desulfosarcinaceae bacterium]
MGELISLAKKRQDSDQEKASQERQRKIQAVRRVLQCTQCAAKCEKCGAGIATDEVDEGRQLRIPYQLCEDCGDEYLDYIERLKGKGDAEQYWHNDAWMRIWRAWIDYQGAIDQYLKTKEFERLLTELRTSQDRSSE